MLVKQLLVLLLSTHPKHLLRFFSDGGSGGGGGGGGGGHLGANTIREWDAWHIRKRGNCSTKIILINGEMIHIRSEYCDCSTIW